MRLSLAGTLTVVALFGASGAHDGDAATARCTMILGYPSAVGQSSYMLAVATSESVKAQIDARNPLALRPDSVPAQIMHVDDIAGFQEGPIRDGLRASGGNAVFIRYDYDMGCNPYAARDGAFDAVGVHGLYVGKPRPADRWVGGRPTFDILVRRRFPLPQGLKMIDGSSTVTAEELFAMYRTLWAESVTLDDHSLEYRIRTWLASNPSAARKRSSQDVIGGIWNAAIDATASANPVPFAGAYAISIVVPGIDSLFMYGKTLRKPRPWLGDPTTDSSTGTTVAFRLRSVSIDLTTSKSADGPIYPCSAVPVVFDRLPIDVSDSTWSGSMWPNGFFECAVAGIPGAKKIGVPQHSSTAKFSRSADGRITFEARMIQDGKAVVVIRGERVSTATNP